MTIRRRLTISFVVILLLFGLNLVIYFWGNQRREATVEELRRAISRQGLIAQISQGLNDVQKQVSLLSQVPQETGNVAAVDPEELAQFTRQLQNTEERINEL